MFEDYYNKHTADYIDATIGLDMSKFYDRFLKHLPQGGSILDLGCGPGRDAKAFLDRGYDVSAVDGSIEMVRYAKAHTGLPVLHKQFEDLNFDRTFDGIFACASLLHVKKQDLPDLLTKLHGALNPGGVLYMSFKHGDFEGERNGRYFTDLTEAGLAALLAQVPFIAIDTWRTSDIRPGRGSEEWLNAVVRMQ